MKNQIQESTQGEQMSDTMTSLKERLTPREEMLESQLDSELNSDEESTHTLPKHPDEESQESTQDTASPSEQESTQDLSTKESATNIAHRQATLDKLKELAQAAKNAEALGYIIKSFYELNTDRLERVQDTRAALLKKAKELAKAAQEARDIYILTKYTQTLGENPPSVPSIRFSHKELLKNASGELEISPSHSDTHGSNLTYELHLTNLAATKTQNLEAGSYTLTATNASSDTSASIKARAISPTGAVSEWSKPISVKVKASVFAGFIENIDTNKSRRINTGTAEDNLWLDKVQDRLNEKSNDDPVTKFFDRADMPHSHIKRYALKNDGTLESIPQDADLSHQAMQKYKDSALWQCVSKIPEHHIIDIEFRYNSQEYLLKLCSLSPFSFDLNAYGYQGYTNLSGRGADKNGVISSVKVEGFYLGSWESVSLGGMQGSFFLSSNPKPTTEIDRPSFRSQTQQFNKDMKIQNHHEREALAFLYSIERGYLGSTADSKSTDQSKWAIYSWNTSANNTSNLYEAISFATGDKTMSIPVSGSDKRAKMFIYRGICNPAGNVWEFVDGIYLNNKLVYLANHEQAYSDETSSNGYTNTGHIVNITSWSQVKRTHAGTMIPKSTEGGTSTNGTTDGGWIADGLRLCLIGGSLHNSAHSGLFAWLGRNELSNRHWAVGSRPCFKKTI